MNEKRGSRANTLSLILALSLTAGVWQTSIPAAPPSLPPHRSQLSSPAYDQSVIRRHVAEYGVFFGAQREGRTMYGGHDRRHSLPLITGDGFLHLADAFVENEAEDGGRWGGRPGLDAGWCAELGAGLALSAHEATIVFVAAPQVATFWTLCAARLVRLIVLVTHNGDEAMPGDDLARHLDSPKLVHWFAQNCDRAHAKLTCLPIGLENRQWGRPRLAGSHGSAPELMLGMLSGLAPALPAAAVALRAITAARAGATIEHSWAWFNVETHAEVRQPLRDLIIAGKSENPPRATWIRNTGGRGPTARLEPHELYRETLAMTSVVCPRGNGLDAHRMWEALYLGRTIIVLAGPLDPLWNGLPVLVLQTWDELLDANAESRVLNATLGFAERAQELEVEKLFLPYWACLIGRAAQREAEFCSSEGLLRVLQRASPT